MAGALIGRATADGGHRGGAVADPLRQAVALLERDADVRRGWPAAAATVVVEPPGGGGGGGAEAALAPDLHAALDALVAETAASVGGEGAAATRRAAAVLWWALLTAATAVGITAAPLVVDLLLDLSALPPLAAALHLPLSTASAVHLLAWGSVAAGATTAPGAPHPASATTTAAAAIATAGPPSLNVTSRRVRGSKARTQAILYRQAPGPESGPAVRRGAAAPASHRCGRPARWCRALLVYAQ